MIAGRHLPRLAAALVLSLAATAPALGRGDPGADWWTIVAALADDRMAGRMTGSPGYDAAAALVVREFRRIGLKPAGTEGYYQPVDLIEQSIDLASSSAGLVGKSGRTDLSIPRDLYFRGAHAVPAAIDAPMVFAGYGLSIPALGYDDFAGLDLHGKLVVVMAGGPADIPGSVKAAARSERVRMLARRGAVGLISLTTERQVEIPWERQMTLSGRSSMYLAEAPLRAVAGEFLSVTFAPDRAAMLFADAPHAFAQLAALADASRPLPRFAMAQRLAAQITATRKPVRSANIVARLAGSDPRLARQHIVLTAHLDGLGIGEPSDGDAIYNGALDNAAGVATVIAVARDLARRGKRPKRSIVFMLPTAEEMGLLGSSLFVQRPTVPRESIVANVNFDMPLPIFPLRTITPIGYEESSLGDDAQAVSAAMNLPIVPDPFPDRNVFIRSDQYSFVRAGIPALFPKFGFAAGTPEAVLERDWRARIYHSPRDDMSQPILLEEAVRLNVWTAALLRRVANNPEAPVWRPASQFSRRAD